jgi:ABC-type nitrate/sulfonate/bicarbonate transport system substrate-binding protein
MDEFDMNERGVIEVRSASVRSRSIHCPVRHQALMTGIVHGVVANFDGTALLADRGYHSVAKAGKFMKGFAGSLSVTQGQLEKRPDDVLRVVRATLKEIRAYLTQRDEAIKHSSAWTKITPANAAKVHELMSAGALAPDGVLDRATMESVIQESREVAGVKRAVRLDEVFDFRPVQRANDELRTGGPKRRHSSDRRSEQLRLPAKPRNFTASDTV